MQNEWNVERIGTTSPCSEIGLLVLRNGDWNMESVHVNKPCTSWSIAPVLVHSIIPVLCPLFNSEFIAVNVHDICLKKKWNVEWIGSIFPCSETSLYYKMDIERLNQYMCSNHVPHSVNNTGRSSLNHSLVHISNCEFIVVKFITKWVKCWVNKARMSLKWNWLPGAQRWRLKDGIGIRW